MAPSSDFTGSVTHLKTGVAWYWLVCFHICCGVPFLLHVYTCVLVLYNSTVKLEVVLNMPLDITAKFRILTKIFIGVSHSLCGVILVIVSFVWRCCMPLRILHLTNLYMYFKLPHAYKPCGNQAYILATCYLYGMHRHTQVWMHINFPIIIRTCMYCMLSFYFSYVARQVKGGIHGLLIITFLYLR